MFCVTAVLPCAELPVAKLLQGIGVHGCKLLFHSKGVPRICLALLVDSQEHYEWQKRCLPQVTCIVWISSALSSRYAGAAVFSDTMCVCNQQDVCNIFPAHVEGRGVV